MQYRPPNCAVQCTLDLLSISWRSPDGDDAGTMSWHFNARGPVC